MEFCAASDRRFTFTELLHALGRGRLDELERVLQQAAGRVGATRDDAWVATTELWRLVDRDEQRSVAEWTRAIRAWLASRESRATPLEATGLRRADHRQARRDGISCHQARRARLTGAWAAWHGTGETTPALPEPHPEVVLGDRLLAAVAVQDDHPATLALRMRVAGLNDQAIAERLDVAPDVVDTLATLGRERVLDAVGANARFALRRVLGEDNADLGRTTGLAGAAVRMRVARGCRELAALVQTAVA